MSMKIDALDSTLTLLVLPRRRVGFMYKYGLALWFYKIVIICHNIVQWIHEAIDTFIRIVLYYRADQDII